MDADIKKAAEKSWEKVNVELSHSGGVNPYAYVLGYKDGFNLSKEVIEEKDKEIERLKGLLRELTMRGKYAFPQNEQDLKWFEEGLKPTLIAPLLDALDIFNDNNLNQDVSKGE